jgi:hypothetical protein
MGREDQPLVTDGLVEVQDILQENSSRFRGIYDEIYFDEIKERTEKISICNLLDLGTLGLSPILFNILPKSLVYGLVGAAPRTNFKKR